MLFNPWFKKSTLIEEEKSGFNWSSSCEGEKKDQQKQEGINNFNIFFQYPIIRMNKIIL